MTLTPRKVAAAVAQERPLGEIDAMPRSPGQPRPIRILLFALAAALLAGPAAGADGPVLPRFASLSASKVYLRRGPAFGDRVLWIYHRKGLPVEILEQYDVWRRVRMPDGAVGWIHHAMLSSTRTVVVVGKAKVVIRNGPAPGAKAVAMAEPGVIARLGDCRPTACAIRVEGMKGWIDRAAIWGVH